MLVSGDIGVAKPQPEIFQAACEAVGASPSDCLHVGDRLDVDALGARDAGLTGVWFDPRGTGGAPAGVPTILRLSDLPALVLRR